MSRPWTGSRAAPRRDIRSNDDRMELVHVIRPPYHRVGVTAMTSLGDHVFVVRHAYQVEVYDANTFAFTHPIRVPGLRNARGLAACAHHKCLYISDLDFEAPRVYRVRLFSTDQEKWSVGFGPRGLSVNRDHNVVACFFGKIQEFTTHGTLVREIRLQASPWHAVQLSSGHYVISDWTSTGGLSVIDVDGQVLCSSRSSHDEPLQCPTSLAVTKNDIFVVDQLSGSILLFDGSLSSARRLALPVDGTSEPQALCLDESQGRLHLGELVGESRVLVFDVHRHSTAANCGISR